MIAALLLFRSCVFNLTPFSFNVGVGADVGACVVGAGVGACGGAVEGDGVSWGRRRRLEGVEGVGGGGLVGRVGRRFWEAAGA